MSARSTVFVVDDDPGILGSIAWLLESARLHVETYDSGRKLLKKLDPDRPGCLLLDLRMPGMSGLEVQQALAARGIAMPVIFVTGHGDVPAAVRALKAGAFDFFEKPFNDQDLLTRIQEALALDLQIRGARELTSSVRERVESLTARQRGILELIVAGATSRDIAQQLGLSTSTVEGHRIKILKRMRASGLVDLVRMTASLGVAPAFPPDESPPPLVGS